MPTTHELEINLKTPTGQPLEGAKIELDLSKGALGYITNGDGFFVFAPVRVVTDANGRAVSQLYPSSDFDPAPIDYVASISTGQSRAQIRFRMPDADFVLRP